MIADLRAIVKQVDIIEYAGAKQRSGGRSNHYWLCKCLFCNKIFYGEHDSLKRSRTVSCGCYKRTTLIARNKNNKYLTHGKSYTIEYKTWQGIHSRCYNKNNIRYKDYGKRGIKVCKRWHRSNVKGFENFYNDMSKKPKGLTIERINNDKNYSPNNCKWATNTEQQFNKRNSLKPFVYKGFKGLLSEHCTKYGLLYKRVYEFARVNNISHLKTLKLYLQNNKSMRGHRRKG